MTELNALVTGASRGIGAALARELAGRGYNLTLNARDETALAALEEELWEADVTLCVADLTTPEGMDHVKSHLERCDVLVNNAGMGEPGAFGASSPADNDALIDLNIRALVSLTSAALPGMLARRRGRILNVASVAAFGPVPNMAVYAASKAFVLSFTEALSEELRDTGVTLTALCPGITDTEMTRDLREQMPGLPGAVVGTPEDVAAAGIEALFERRVISVPGLANQAAVELARLNPRGVVRNLAGFAARLGMLGR
ncbi:MAG: short-chain dehydrogenase [Gammaproteobacteria bacterium]|nr:short-chain dehydrogenase [Gammaproteobacteria bacterium]